MTGADIHIVIIINEAQHACTSMRVLYSCRTVTFMKKTTSFQILTSALTLFRCSTSEMTLLIVKLQWIFFCIDNWKIEGQIQYHYSCDNVSVCVLVIYQRYKLKCYMKTSYCHSVIINLLINVLVHKLSVSD